MAAKIIDRSFLFLKQSIAEVYDALDDTQMAMIWKRDYLQFGTTDTIRQTTNCPVDFNMAQDFKCELVTHCDILVKDITENVTLCQFQNQETGLYNAIIEIANLGTIQSRPVHLKFTQTTQPTNIWYSNPFQVTDKLEDTTYFEYRDYGVTYGIDYGTTDVYNTIRLKGHFTKSTNATNRNTYQQVGENGNMIRQKLNVSLPQNFITEYQDEYGLRAFAYMCAMSVVYICKGYKSYGERATNIVDTSDELLGSTNFFAAGFVANIDQTDVRAINQLAITTPFKLLQAGLQPSGIYIVSEASTLSIKGFFNKDITIGGGKLIVYKNGVQFKLYQTPDITPVGSNGFEITDFIGQITEAADYYIKFTTGLFFSPIMETYGVVNTTEWAWSVVDEVDYDSDDYDTNDYFAG